MDTHFSTGIVAAWMLVVVMGLGWPQAAPAQPISLSWMPASVAGVSGYDLHGLRRPALSITGFDNTATGYSPDYGLGLKQILERRFNDQDPLVVSVFDQVVAIAHREQMDPFAYADVDARRLQLDANTVVLESRAFEALATFVLEQNGYGAGDLAGSGLRSHAEAFAALMSALVDPPGGVLIGPARATDGEVVVDDPVKYSRSIGNVARAIDLYLALENAYVQAGADVRGLLLAPDKIPLRMQVFQEYGTALLFVDMVLGLRAIDQYSADIDLPPQLKERLLRRLSHLPAGDRVVEEVEPGNWAMKQRVAVGYGSLAMEAAPGSEEAALLAELLPKAIRSVRVVGEQNEDRLRHWNFMSYGGKRFWAESAYYLDFSLEQVLPFWHTLRANGMLGEISDPFYSTWFTNPLSWHADLATPDGRTVPLDDGNKAPVRYAGLMRWDARYGDETLGKKYAWIDDRRSSQPRGESTLLVELAVPRTGRAEPPVEQVGNFGERIVRNESEQQLVLRSTEPGGTHFLLLNGEHGAAVDRGEGHEQPDQLQLLYYVDDLSYLLDSGYDRAETVENSSWNHYGDHNVMTAGEGEGGLLPPILSLLEVRKASEPWFMGEVDELNFKPCGRAVSVLHGKQNLNVEPARNDQANDGSEPFDLEDLMLKRQPFGRAAYSRDVLFIGGANPYLIDVNTIAHQMPPATCEAAHFRMHYHANADQIVVPDDYHPRRDGFLRWEAVGGRRGRYLHAFPMSVEFDLMAGDVVVQADDAIEEEGSAGKERVDIKKLVLYNAARCEPFWTVATIFEAGEGAEPVGRRPELVWRQDPLAKQQGWIWPRGDGIFDVFVVRSAAELGGNISFNPSRVNLTFPEIALYLPAGAPYGFARLERANGGWRLDPAYIVHLMASEAADKQGELAAETTAAFAGPYELTEPYPNPLNPTARFALRLREDQVVAVEVFDALGRRVAMFDRGRLEAGRVHTFEIDGSAWAGGLYLVRIGGERFTTTRRLLLIK